MSPWWMSLVFALVVLICGTLAAFWGLTFGNEWEKKLKKPKLFPPYDWMFWVVWLILYPLIGAATWFVWRQHTEVDVTAIMLFNIFHLLAAYSWVPIVNKAKSARAAVIMDVFVGILGFSTAFIFLSYSLWAYIFMIPYLCWTIFTTIIKFWRMYLNPQH